jgi:hypothetical protein
LLRAGWVERFDLTDRDDEFEWQFLVSLADRQRQPAATPRDQPDAHASDQLTQGVDGLGYCHALETGLQVGPQVDVRGLSPADDELRLQGIEPGLEIDPGSCMTSSSGASQKSRLACSTSRWKPGPPLPRAPWYSRSGKGLASSSSAAQRSFSTVLLIDSL